MFVSLFLLYVTRIIYSLLHSLFAGVRTLLVETVRIGSRTSTVSVILLFYREAGMKKTRLVGKMRPKIVIDRCK